METLPKNQSFFMFRILLWISFRLRFLFLSRFIISVSFSSNQSEPWFLFLPKVWIAAFCSISLKLLPVVWAAGYLFIEILLKTIDLFSGYGYGRFDRWLLFFLSLFQWEGASADDKSMISETIRSETVISDLALELAKTWSNWCQCFDLECCHVHLSRLGSWNMDPIMVKWFCEQNSRRIKPFEFIFPVPCFPKTSGHSS